MTLEWLNHDEQPVQFDDTVVFGKGYDWDWFEISARTAKGKTGMFVIWKHPYGTGFRWSLYRDTDGAMMSDRFVLREQAEAEAERWDLEVMG